MVVKILVVLLAVIQFGLAQNSTCFSKDGIQDIRLVDGTFGDFSGRVEIKFNETWGTVCDDLWSLTDANVACRMLGFERGAGCAVSRAGFGQGPALSPIWLDNVGCRGSEKCLDDCSFLGLGDPITFCSHREDAGVICLTDEIIVTPPSVLNLVNSTTSSLAISFRGVSQSQLPSGASTIRYRLSYKPTDDDDAIQRNSYFFPSSISPTQEDVVMFLTNLQRNTEYSVQVGVDFRYDRRICFSYVVGPLSDPFIFQTNETLKETNISIRLSSSQSGANFSGRVEVLFNGTWGTVCRDSFSTIDANVICRALNFDRALCVPFGRSTTPGTGPIWLDDLSCTPTSEVLEDCSHPGWGVHNCNHLDDVSVVCDPGENFLSPVTGVVIADVQATSATIQWERSSFPNIDASFSYQVFFESASSPFRSSRTVTHPTTELRLTRLTVGDTYNVTVRPLARMSSCFFSSFFGRESDIVNFTTFVSPPTGPPTDFHVVVLNSTTVEVQWEDPLLDFQNGEITSYVIFVRPRGGAEREIEIFTNSTEFDVARLVTNLTPSTEYRFSVLAVNAGGRGPRTLILTGTTFAAGAEPIINRFGLNGDNLDRLIRFTFQTNLNIHCGSSRNNVQIDWLAPDGEKIGISDRNRRVGHFPNGTAVLQIAAFRRLNSCDGGVYMCIATVPGTQEVQQKAFTLFIGSIPPRPNRVFPLTVTSNSVTIGWENPVCNGGHNIIEYNINYYERVVPFFSRTLLSIRHINAEETNYTYTVENLSPSTSYDFQIQAVRSDLRGSSFSISRTITTFPPAPSPPRDVNVRIVGVNLLEVSWRPPAISNGIIIRYTVYITLFGVSNEEETERQRRQVAQEPNVITAIFSGTDTSGNVTVPSTDVTYSVQVTASIQTGDNINEGQLSNFTSVDVPKPVLPLPQDLRVVEATNSSITLQWQLPSEPFLPVTDFIVKYSSIVKWNSPLGEDIQFSESGSISVPSTMNTAQISPLTPGTTYSFAVAASSSDEVGQEALFNGNTVGGATDPGRVAFFQLKFGPVDRCSSFQVGNTQERLNMVKNAIAVEINKLCSCGFTADHLQNSVFSCSGLVQQIVYRARILGTSMYNARDLVSLVQAWVDSGAKITPGLFSFDLDSTCSSYLDTLRSPDCEELQVTTSTFTSLPVESPQNGVTTGEVVTVVIALLIIIILLGIVVMLCVLLYRKQTSGGSRGVISMMRFRNETKEEDKLPFADMEPSSEADVDSKPEILS